jgi:SNF2 family DNA or RNA helicase
LNYHFIQNHEATPWSGESILPPVNLSSGMGVTAHEYGTIIASPASLEGAPGNATYSSLQYLLHTKKVVNFPIPKKFEGKMILNIDTKTESFPKLRFKYLDIEEKTFFQISLLEGIYLFNWQNGEAYALNADQRDLIIKLRRKITGDIININEVLAYALTVDQHFLNIELDGHNTSEIPVINPICKIHLEPSDDTTFISFSIFFHDQNDIKIDPPRFLQHFTHSGGRLGDFTRKKDAYQFIQDLTLYLKKEVISFRNSLTQSKVRDFWFDEITALESRTHTLEYDPISVRLIRYEHSFFQDLVSAFFECFGEVFFRFALVDKNESCLSYKITYNNLISGLFAFQEKLKVHQLEIYYDKKEIRGWRSKIRFERRQSSEKWFDLDLELSPEDLEVIRKADIESGIALTSAGMVVLDRDAKNLARFMQKYTKYEGQEIDSENVEGSENIESRVHKFVLPFSRARIFELFELKKLGVEGVLTQEEEDLCEKLRTLDKIPEYELPKEIKGELRPYQVTGYRWLRFLYEHKLGACLADDMGLGKTIQTITFIQSIYHEVNRILIVCPVSILLNWENEFKKFSNMPVHIFHGGERSFPDDAKIVLTSYGLMKKEVHSAFEHLDFDLIIMDEVQHLKNIRSLGAYAARKLKANFRICLTGTPVENDLAEFFNILDLAIPGLWGDLEFVRTSSNQKTRLLARNSAKPFILRRTKAQVLTELPPKIEQNVILNFSEEEKKTYLERLVKTKNLISNSPSKQKYGEILKGLLYLRQSCLWQSESTPPNPKNYQSTKIDFMMEQLEQILEEGHQALVFSQFTTYLDLMQHILREKHWKLSRIDGSMNVNKRQAEVEQFQSGKTQVFLISLKAGGLGLNLTAASYVFLMDPWWNPAVENQAIDRAHRIGQMNKLTVFKPIIKDSVEEKVLKLQDTKRELFKDLLPDDSDNYFSGKLSMKDFEHLLSE